MRSEQATGETPRRKFRLVDDPDESWREFGRSDPYFGVLSTDRYRAANLDEAALKEFFASGDAHIARVLDIIACHLNVPTPAGDALDFGCGVGRLVLPLARRFHSVVGIDISDAYIAEAMRNRDRNGLNNIEFFGNLSPFQSNGRQFDLVHSYIVFNHIPWERGKTIIGDLFALLRPGGVLAVHVLHRRQAGPIRRAVSWARRNFAPLHWLINLGRGRRAFEPLMQGNEYPLDTVLPFLHGLGAQGFHVEIEPTQDGDLCAFIFCAKAESTGP
jgi:2-polyprenyl-3-methyl-5-hydroxy-6-metoxy-1,4-benzoquinol methylase